MRTAIGVIVLANLVLFGVGAKAQSTDKALQPTCPSKELKVNPLTAGKKATVTVCGETDSKTRIEVYVDGKKAGQTALVGEFAIDKSKKLNLSQVGSVVVQQTVAGTSKKSDPIKLPVAMPNPPTPQGESPCDTGTNALPFVAGPLPQSQESEVVICADPEASKIELFNGKAEGTPLATLDRSNLTGVYTATLLVADKNRISAVQISKDGVQTVSNEVTPTKSQFNMLFTRAIAGTDISGASSADTSQKYYIEIGATAPLFTGGGNSKKGGKSECPSAPEMCRIWGWVNPRIADVTLPANAGANAGVSSTITGLFPGASSPTNLTKIVHGFEFLGGIDMRMHNGPHFGKTTTSLEWTISGGAVTPFSASETAQIFLVTGNNALLNQYPTLQKGCTSTDAMGTTTQVQCTYVAFVPPDRDRFFRQYYTGLRLKSFYRDKECAGDQSEGCGLEFPGTFDVTVGRNEQVTGGILRGAVLRLEGFYPLPFYRGVYVYATVFTRFKPAKSTTPIIAAPAVNKSDGTAVSLTESDLLVIPSPPRDRDSFRLGIGFDIAGIINNYLKKNAAGSSTTGETSKASGKQ